MKQFSIKSIFLCTLTVLSVLSYGQSLSFPACIGKSKQVMDKAFGKGTKSKEAAPRGFAIFDYKVPLAKAPEEATAKVIILQAMFTKNLERSVFFEARFSDPVTDWQDMAAKLGLKSSKEWAISSPVRGNVRSQISPIDNLPAKWVATARNQPIEDEASLAVWGKPGHAKTLKFAWLKVYDTSVNLP